MVSVENFREAGRSITVIGRRQAGWGRREKWRKGHKEGVDDNLVNRKTAAFLYGIDIDIDVDIDVDIDIDISYFVGLTQARETFCDDILCLVGLPFQVILLVNCYLTYALY